MSELDTVDDEDRARARRMFHRIFGEEYGDLLAAQLGEGNFNLVLMCRVAPEIWEFPVPELRVKLLIAIAVCCAMHQDVRYFVRAAIHNGISRAEVEGTLLLAGLEGGFPAASVARRLVQQAFEEHAQLLTSLGRPVPNW